MKIHEYQAKELLKKYKVATQDGVVVTKADKAAEASKKIGGTVVLKAQVHSGGRGKAGGVKLAKTPAEAKEIAEKMLGMKLVTNQTGPEGKIVKKVLVTNAIEIKKEFYLSIAVDNESAGYVIIASADGGTEIEETAEKHPEKITKLGVSHTGGFKSYHSRYIAKRLGLSKEHTREFDVMLKGLAALFVEKDCSLVEINPLIIDGNDRLLALDAKINFDDNALMRHPEIVRLRDKAEENKKETEAAKYDLSYISLDGNIGCMVNGAGLAMATMDIIHAYGGHPANFLDVGGSATAERVAAAFKILLSDKNVKAIMINIFGGIMKCDVIAEGIISAANTIKIKVPLIVRLDGTNVEKGKKLLAQSGLRITAVDTMAQAAQESVRQAGGGKKR